MKFRSLFLISVVLFFSVASIAQEKNFELEISVDKTELNFFKVPKENKYFYARIQVCKRAETKKAKPICNQYISNEIVLNFK